MEKGQKYMRLIRRVSLLILIIFVYCFTQNNWIKVEKITIKINNMSAELTGLKIAHISDVHLPKNASSVEHIINKVKHQKPDIIVLTGDLIDASADLKTCGLNKLAKGLSEITKTYAVTGNHEIWNGHVDEWEDILTDNNVKVIDNKIEIYTKNNKSLAILGLQDGYEYNPEKFKDIQKIKELPIILLAHRPELFASYYSSANNIKPNIVFSGHAHGGQFRIPIINKGIIAPNQGMFPQYTSGVYNYEDVNMIVSRGLGNSIIPIRINNRPDLLIIELTKKSKNKL